MSAVSFAWSNYRNSIYNYDPNLPAACVGLCAYVLVSIVHVWSLIQYRAHCLWLLPIGALISCIGHTARVYSILHNTNVPSFFLAYIALLLGPSLVTLACITTFDRIVWIMTPPEQHSWKKLWFHTRYFHIIFIIFSASACGLQLLGMCLTANMFTDMLISEGTDPMGIRILKVGLIIQIAYILLLQVLGLRYVLLVRGWQIADSKKAGFVRLLWTLNTVTFLIMIRAIFRTVEVFGSGPRELSDMVLQEWPLWVFDFVPVFGLLVVLCVVYPGHVLPTTFLSFHISKKKLLREANGMLSDYDLAKLTGTYLDTNLADVGGQR